MKLCEHRDFAALLVATARATGLNEQFVEKDYYVTEVLRIIAGRYRGQVIFKGGTSLSKGWALIDRFSEDVDLFVDPASFDPPLRSARAIDRELRTLRDRVAAHPASSSRRSSGRRSAAAAAPTISPTPPASTRCRGSRAPSGSSLASKAATTPSSNEQSTRSSPRSCASKAKTGLPMTSSRS